MNSEPCPALAWMRGLHRFLLGLNYLGDCDSGARENLKWTAGAEQTRPAMCGDSSVYGLNRPPPSCSKRNVHQFFFH